MSVVCICCKTNSRFCAPRSTFVSVGKNSRSIAVVVMSVGCSAAHSNIISDGKVQVHQNHFHQKKFFIKIHFHQKPLSSKTTFIKNQFHQKPISSKKQFHQNATFIKMPLSSKTTFIKNHFHQRPISSETNFIRDHFHQKPFSSKTNFIKTNFIRALPVRGTHHPSKNNIVRVCVKASRAEGPRRLHTNTAYAHLLGLSWPFCWTLPARRPAMFSRKVRWGSKGGCLGFRV